MPRLLAIPVLALLLLASAPARAEEPDLPGAWADAPTAPLGAYTGTLGGTDDQDWLRIEIPDNARLTITLTIDADVHVNLVARSDAGAWLFEERLLEAGGSVSREVDGDAVRLGVDAWSASPVGYTLTVLVLTSPDLTPASLEVAPVGVRGRDARVLREIAVDVMNRGGEHADGALRLSVRTDDGAEEFIASIDLSIAPGESERVSVVWSPLRTGTLGRATVVAATSVEHDGHPENDEATAETFSLARPLGSRTLRAERSQCVANPIEVVPNCAHAHASPTSIGAGDNVNFLLGSQTLALAHGDDEDEVAYASGWTPFSETATIDVRSGDTHSAYVWTDQPHLGWTSVGAFELGGESVVQVCHAICVTQPLGGPAGISARAMEEENPVGPVGVELDGFGGEGGSARLCATTCVTA